MALVVQTAEGVTGANSYVSLADARSIATLNGWTVSADDAELEADLRAAMIYLESMSYQGARDTAELSFPRLYLYVDGFGLDPIPSEIVTAQVRLASLNNSKPILPETSKRRKSFRLEGVYSEELFEPTTIRQFSDVDALLSRLTRRSRPEVGRV